MSADAPRADRLEHYVSPAPFDPLAVETLTPEQERFYLASQWKMMWWKFRRHRIAVDLGRDPAAALRLDPGQRGASRPTTCTRATSRHIYAPPQARAPVPRGPLRRAVRLRPTAIQLNMETLKREYRADPTQRSAAALLLPRRPVPVLGPRRRDASTWSVPAEGGTAVPARHRPARPRHAVAHHLRRPHLAHRRPDRHHRSASSSASCSAASPATTAAGSTT